ncbi:MAG: hypothetical protein H7210_04765, partial [Pyrinomonadaceae bacterium]|nr:hypothetical protein [Phycisphaerales bacterium]
GGAMLISDATNQHIRAALPALIEQSSVIGTANHAASSISSLAIGLESCLEMPAWVPRDTQESFRRQVDLSLVQTLAPEANGAADELIRLASSAELIRKVHQIKRMDTKVLRELRELSLNALGHSPRNTKPPEAADAIRGVLLPILQETFSGVYDVPAPAETSLVREVKPAWRALEPELRRAKETYVSAGVRACRTDPTPGNPALLAARSGLGQAHEDLQALMRISWWLEGNSDGGPPVLQVGQGGKAVAAVLDGQASLTVTPQNDMQAPRPANAQPRAASDKQHKAAALRMLKLGQLLARQPSRDTALEAVRVFARGVRLCSPLPGESSLRAAMSGGGEKELFDAMTGSRTLELITELDSARDDFLESWSQHAGSPADVSASLPSLASLETLRELLTAMQEAGDVERLVRSAEADNKNGGSGPIRNWCRVQSSPAWEMTAGAMRLLSNGIDIALAGATAKLLGGDEKAAATTIKQVRHDYAVVFLFAVLENQAVHIGILPTPAYVEFAEPPPVLSSTDMTMQARSAWLIRQRDSLAQVSWFGEEYAAAMRTNDTMSGRDKEAKAASVRYVDALRKYVNDSAAEVLKVLPHVP